MNPMTFGSEYLESVESASYGGQEHKRIAEYCGPGSISDGGSGCKPVEYHQPQQA